MTRGWFIAGLLVFSAAAWAQSVISAHSGVINHLEGDVTIDGAAIHPKLTEFPDIKPGQVLATEDGRVEVLLTPGVFLRLKENSSIRMLSNSLADTHIEVVSGAALVEVGQLLRKNAITIEARGVEIALPKEGLYRIEAGTAAGSLRVYKGEARIASGSSTVKVKRGREIELDDITAEAGKFDPKERDPLYQWSAKRADYVAKANVISARTASNSSYSTGFTGGSGSWAFNPGFGMFTYLPGAGIYGSPFGPQFYSPAIINFVYIPNRSFGGVSSRPGSVGARTTGGPGLGQRGLGHTGVGGPRGGGVRGR
jgi:hypothetical protein